MHRKTSHLVSACLALILICAPLSAGPAAQHTASTPAPAVVPVDVALGSLMTLGDEYLKKLAGDLSLVALTDQAQKARWDFVRPWLAAVVERNVDALVWFALPDGTYWSVQEGLSSGNLSDRPYFTRVLAGETVIGALVGSKATGRPSAIVAVPIFGRGGDVVGAFGASVYLDQLSARLDAEMAIGDDLIFYSFDSTPLLALEWDPALTFVDPFQLGPEIRAVFEYMLARDEGTVRYRWSGRWRTVTFRRSQVTGWWYVFGVVS